MMRSSAERIVDLKAVCMNFVCSYTAASVRVFVDGAVDRVLGCFDTDKAQ